ncbi:hypothetical protein [Streptomyces mirabilis]|uniref:hypothetical protein n=1 Tax=Streptomyces mirabilis TaxID=68239 RepID=UPI003690DA6C
MTADTRKAVVNAAAGEPWRCHDCGEWQELKTSRGRSWYSNAGWYWAQLHPGEEPVHLDASCFESYDIDWPDYIGTHESSAWQGGSWEGKWLWALPADYFERRDAYRRLPRWERTASGWDLVDSTQQILGRIEGYPGDNRKRGLYRALDARREPLPDGPMTAPYAMGSVEVHLGLGGPGQVRR